SRVHLSSPYTPPPARYPPSLHRRSSDLPAAAEGLRKLSPEALVQKRRQLEAERQKLLDARAERQLAAREDSPRDLANLSLVETRSEEHTSELQSRVDLVCRLLLEKKNDD